MALRARIIDNVRMTRRFVPLFWLLVVAILARGMLPWINGQTMARHSGNDILLAFCGTVSPALLAKMQRVSPWTDAQDQTDPNAGSGASCPLCLTGALTLALMAFAILQLLQRQRLFAPLPALRQITRKGWRRYDSRGPPRFAPATI